MLVDKPTGGIATWWFEAPVPTRVRSRETLRELLVRCQVVIEILASHELLNPSRVVMGKWTQRGSDVSPVLTNEPAHELPLNPERGGKDFLDICEGALDELEQIRGFLYPHHVEISGVGTVVDAEGKRAMLPNLCCVWGTTLGYQTVSVKTYSDAWLPYTLAGEPQPDVWRLNAPRLEAALREIHVALGVAPDYEPETPYARVHDYTLSNHTYDDGEVIEVV